jgi:hypothetical protein
MSCDQLALENKIGVNADSFATQSALQHMSRRCIMNLSIQATRIAGLASSSLFCTSSACASITPTTLLASLLEHPCV